MTSVGDRSAPRAPEWIIGPASQHCQPAWTQLASFAEWIDGREKHRTAPVTTGQDVTDRIVITARTYTAKFRDGSGIVREVATGCRDESASQVVKR